MSKDAPLKSADEAVVHARIEQALKNERYLLASALDNLPIGVRVYDAAGSMTHSDERIRDYAGAVFAQARQTPHGAGQVSTSGVR